MKFQELNRIGGEETNLEIETTLEAAKAHAEALFEQYNFWALEETKYDNGKVAFTVKRQGNKIIYQLKTIEPI